MKFTLTLIFALTLSAQWLPTKAPGVGGNPNNSYGKFPPTYDLAPNSSGSASACVQIVNSDGTTSPVVGQSVTMQGWATTGSGGHFHESNDPARPTPTITSSFTLVTGSNGCATWVLQWPAASGWWTLQYLTPGAPTVGQNFYLRVGNNQYDASLPRNFLPVDLPFRTLTGPQAMYSPDTRATAIGFASPYPYDGRHLGLSRFVSPLIGTFLLNGAQLYKTLTDTALGGGQHYPEDTVDMRRGTIPHGGRADNEYQVPQPPWITDLNEQHFDGNGVDLSNPSYGQGQGEFNAYNRLINAMISSGCVPGNVAPTLSAPIMNQADSVAYWRINIWVHVNCATPTYGRGVGNGGRGH